MLVHEPLRSEIEKCITFEVRAFNGEVLFNYTVM